MPSRQTIFVYHMLNMHLNLCMYNMLYLYIFGNLKLRISYIIHQM